MTDAPLAASAAASGSAASAPRQSTPPSAAGRCRDTARTAMPCPARCAARALPTWPVPNTTCSRSSPMSRSSLTPSAPGRRRQRDLDACGRRYAGHRKLATYFLKYPAPLMSGPGRTPPGMSGCCWPARSSSLRLAGADGITVTGRGRAGSGPAPVREQGDDLADGRLPGAGPGYRQVRLDLVAVAAAVLLRDHVAGLGQVGDDAVGAALGDTQAGRDVAQSRAWVAGDVQQDPGVVGQEAPLRHADKHTTIS